MTDPEAFYNREDLWTVATEVGMGAEANNKPRPCSRISCS